MKLYHGSTRLFDKYEVDKSRSISDGVFYPEGLGLYMTENLEIAKRYSDLVHIYEFDFTEEEVLDFTKEDTVQTYFESIQKELDVEFISYLDVKGISEKVMEGYMSIRTLGQEISSILSSDESFYMEHESAITFEEDCLLSRLVRIAEDKLFVYKYYDRSFDENIHIAVKNFDLIPVKRLILP